MSKKVLTLAVIALGVDAIIKAFNENPKDAAAEIIEASKEQEALAATIKERDTTIETLTKEKGVLAALNEANGKEIEKLSKEKPAVEATETKGKTFENNGKKYGFVFHAMTHKKIKITSDMVAKDVKLQDELIAIGSGMIEEI